MAEAVEQLDLLLAVAADRVIVRQFVDQLPNARSLLALARATVPAMDTGSAIVAISSLGSHRVLDNYVLIGTSKAALESVVRYLGVELAPRGIRVNAVSAGVVETGALEHFPNREEMLRVGASNPVGRLVTPEDVAGAVAFLCSRDAEIDRKSTRLNSSHT